ncbi:trypsin, alkaline A-like [Hyposmocoma kahamanoa]|uniref:trypsin, alkaline A-like n=1 Tax=Hyposmocoma kahamanoa TaxID=1477025 RepID=UPI000E6D9CB4|nr:trypsin, alkaline A-like [Hyposmocoma kahamanoa]
MRIAVALLACLAIASAEVAGPPPDHYEPQRIVGGSLTTINQYPFGVALLYSAAQTTFWQSCGGSILNQRSVLSAAHCTVGTGNVPGRWRSRVGSSFANSGGAVHLTAQIINHPQYNPSTENNDITILRLSSNIQYVGGTVAPSSIAGANYNLGDNQVVWAIGWGRISSGGAASEQLRHVQIWTINQAVCSQRYGTRGISITANMLCSGWLDVGGRDQCQGDSGGPLLHNNIVVGVCSFGLGCADPFFPGVNARVSTASNWIQSNA